MLFRSIASGWIGFYWGKTIDEYAADEPSIASAITRKWLEFFRSRAPEMAVPAAPAVQPAAGDGARQ